MGYKATEQTALWMFTFLKFPPVLAFTASLLSIILIWGINGYSSQPIRSRSCLNPGFYFKFLRSKGFLKMSSSCLPLISSFLCSKLKAIFRMKKSLSTSFQ